MPLCQHVASAPKLKICPVCGHQATTSGAVKNRECPGPPKPAGPIRKAINFGGAMVATALDGFRAAPPELVAARLAVCAGCEHYDQGNNGCKECGCPLHYKPTMLAWECRLGRWPRPETITSPAISE